MNKLPDSCYVGRIIPKDNFKNHKEEFRNKIERIRYMYQISRKTSNYNQMAEQNSIVVINLSLKDDVNIETIVKEIEKSINYNIIYEIEYKSQIKYGFYDSKLFTTNYEDETSFDLLADSVEKLFESLKKQIIGNVTKQLSSQELIEHHLEVDKITNKIERLTKERTKEKQVNKKNELRKEINKLKIELKEINGS